MEHIENTISPNPENSAEKFCEHLRCTAVAYASDPQLPQCMCNNKTSKKEIIFKLFVKNCILKQNARSTTALRWGQGSQVVDQGPKGVTSKIPEESWAIINMALIPNFFFTLSSFLARVGGGNLHSCGIFTCVNVRWKAVSFGLSVHKYGKRGNRRGLY